MSPVDICTASLGALHHDAADTVALLWSSGGKSAHLSLCSVRRACACQLTPFLPSEPPAAWSPAAVAHHGRCRCKGFRVWAPRQPALPNYYSPCVVALRQPELNLLRMLAGGSTLDRLLPSWRQAPAPLGPVSELAHQNIIYFYFCSKSGHCTSAPSQLQVPVQLLLGRLPATGLLQAHGLTQYEPIVAAVRTGGVGTLNSVLAAGQFRFIMEVRSASPWDSRCFFGFKRLATAPK